jgi:16S rRNA processing protein RimM
VKSVQRKDFIAAGRVEKVHGTRGELKLSLDQEIKLKEWVFMEIHGKPVPFFILSVSGESLYPVVRLGGIRDPASAQRVCGLEILAPRTGSARVTKSGDLDIVGFEVVDVHTGILGMVTEVEESPAQALIHVDMGSKNLMIPAAADLVVDIDEANRRITVDLPEGLTDL